MMPFINVYLQIFRSLNEFYDYDLAGEGLD